MHWNITADRAKAVGLKFICRDGGKGRGGRVIGRAYLYVLRNDLHDRPYGYVEDLYVDPSQRGAGLGAQMMEQLIKLARAHGCYKVTATSKDARKAAQALYDKLGFVRHGVEFRLDL